MSVDTTNYDKFQTGNPVVRRLIDRFYVVVESTISGLNPSSVLDAGCGEGESLERLAPLLPDRRVGVDLLTDSLAFASQRIPDAEFMSANLLDLPFGEKEFDLVLCLEVLEHLDEPQAGLAELARVAARDIVISVPHEPWFRLGSFVRGKYVKTLGNHPEHVNHWNPRSLRKFLSDQVQVISIAGSMPWLIAHCRPLS